MTLRSLRLALVAGLVLPLGLASASFAQDAPTSPPGADAGMHQGHHFDPAERRAHMAEHLRAALQLEPGQDAALNAYLDALKPPGDMHQRMEQAKGEMQHLSTPERLDKMLAHFDEMRAHMVARIAATKQFYAQLSPPQQKAFDALAPMMMHHGHHGMGGDHGGFGHHGDGHQMGPGGPPPG